MLLLEDSGKDCLLGLKKHKNLENYLSDLWAWQCEDMMLGAAAAIMRVTCEDKS